MSFHQLQSPQIVDESFFALVLNGISRRKFEKAVEEIPQTFGISKSSVPRKFIAASARQFRQFHKRDLSNQDIIAIFMYGKSFAENQMILALGVTLQEEIIVLGIVNHTQKTTWFVKFPSMAQRERAE